MQCHSIKASILSLSFLQENMSATNAGTHTNITKIATLDRQLFAKYAYFCDKL